jgi:hypothetical protein
VAADLAEAGRRQARAGLAVDVVPFLKYCRESSWRPRVPARDPTDANALVPGGQFLPWAIGLHTWHGITRLSGTDDAEALMQFRYTNQRRVCAAGTVTGDLHGRGKSPTTVAVRYQQSRKSRCRAVA